MITDPKTLSKCLRIETTYEALIFNEVGTLALESFDTDEHLRAVPDNKSPWQAIESGHKWGHAWGNAWFRGAVDVTPDQAGKNLFVRADLGAIETMLFVDGVSRGIFSSNLEVGARGNHHTLMLHTAGDAPGVKAVAFECYAGHPCVGTQPMDSREAACANPASYVKTARGVSIMERRDDVMAFVFDLKTLNQLVDVLPGDSFRKGKIIKALGEVYRIVPQLPGEVSEESWRAALAEARTVMAPLLACKNGDSMPFAGLIGHSHMDTAWLWTSKETIRKCARTFSNALTLMEQYPEYMFIQSSPIHSEMLRDNYPELFERIKERVAEGRYEPNGGAYVETDGNMPSGESFIRQFLYGQKFSKEHFDYRADTFWLPDTFGYSVAFPQVLKGCGIKYFLTTKLGWNDTNKFPHETFTWRGLDGSEVLVHFNISHCWPDAKTLVNSLKGNSIRHRDVSDKRLISYGYGDGGGGPMYEMIEMARRVENLEGVPKSRHMSVSDFMTVLEENQSDYPVYNGELYVELHRGVLTVQHLIKRLNRKCEWALRDLELMDVLGNQLGLPVIDPAFIESSWKVLLKNQFHDILPGTSIPEEHDEAKRSMGAMLAEVQNAARDRLVKSAENGEAVTVMNPFSWDVESDLVVPELDDGKTLGDAGTVCQRVVDLAGTAKTVVSGVARPPLSISCMPLVPRGDEVVSPFFLDGDVLTTPYFIVTFTEQGSIGSLVDRRTGRELRGNGMPLNTLLLGEDVPQKWDNWDIDADQAVKMTPVNTLLTRELTDGPLQFRIRQSYSLGQRSELWQDMIFHRNCARIDFETKVDWKETHSLLKSSFDLNVRAMNFKSDIQFGWTERPTHRNTSYDRARFEVCQHKWSDLSEISYGVALLNDCKYGIGVSDSNMRLSLIKSGGHPDPRGDAGVHFFKYALLPHIGGFNIETVIKPAYEFNHADLVVKGGTSPVDSLVTVEHPNIIVDTVKRAEDGDGIVLRLFDAEGTGNTTTLDFGRVVKRVESANMLEEAEECLLEHGSRLELAFSAFEVKTLIVVP